MGLADFTIDELTGISYECSCGRTHSVDIDKIDISDNALVNAVGYINGLNPGKMMAICDANTYSAACESLESFLRNDGIKLKTHIIQSRDGHDIAPDDSYIGSTLARMEPGQDLFIAVGSGVINDITRHISYKMGTPYIVIATAPSMDGYASVTSSLIINNIKESVQGQYPQAIFAQTDILGSAPDEMLTAGFGDVIGKYNALREWRFGRDINGEHYCSEIAELVEKTVGKCMDTADGLIKREPEAIVNTTEALILAGMAMGLYQNTRPASGAEHHIVHYWDVDCIKRGVGHELHGNSVGIGTVVICRLFELVGNRLPVKVDEIDTKEIISILKRAGCKTHPSQAGISRELFKRSIINGHTMSSKYTILRYLSENQPDILEDAAEVLCDEFYNR